MAFNTVKLVVRLPAHKNEPEAVTCLLFFMSAMILFLIGSPVFAANPASELRAPAAAPAATSKLPDQPTFGARSGHPVLANLDAPNDAKTPAPPNDQKVLDELAAIKTELGKKTNSWLTFFAAVIAALASVAAALLVARSSSKSAQSRERFDDLKAQRELALQALQQLMTWRLKQVEQFYGPLNALLGQSKGVYAQLKDHLIQQSPAKYRQGVDFEVLDDKAWVPFRLLDEMPDIYDARTNSGPLIDELMSVGERMVSVIHSHAGLALSAELEPILAEYLAHFAVLMEMYKAVKDPGARATELRGRYTYGYFPRNFGEVVRKDLGLITTQLRKWEQSLTSLAEKSHVGGTTANG